VRVEWEGLCSPSSLEGNPLIAGPLPPPLFVPPHRFGERRVSDQMRPKSYLCEGKNRTPARARNAYLPAPEGHSPAGKNIKGKNGSRRG